VERIPVIIDTDPGIDDFFALMLANSSDKLDIKAVTSVAGNQKAEIVTKNALDIASYFHMDCEVAKGAEQPLNTPPHTAGHIHGENGLGNLVLKTEKKKALSPDYAWDVIYKHAVKENGRLEIIAIGPLTNIAIALLKYPDLHKLIHRIVIMGGTSDIGNISPYGEFNAVADPLAAKIVFRSGTPLVMVGWNATMKSRLTPDNLEQLKAIDTPYTKDCSFLWDFVLKAYRSSDRDYIVLSDALAVAYVLDPSVMECKDYYVAVETASSLNMGRTVVDFDHVCKDKPLNCSVGVEVNHAAYLNLLKEMMNHYRTQ
jgi:pyrimidine-specific ribonucleoside hydrolase